MTLVLLCCGCVLNSTILKVHGSLVVQLSCLSHFQEEKKFFDDRFCNCITEKPTYSDMQSKLRKGKWRNHPCFDMDRVFHYSFNHQCVLVANPVHWTERGQRVRGLWRSLVSPDQLHKANPPLGPDYETDPVNIKRQIPATVCTNCK